MALSIKVELVEVGKKAATITIKDTTGAYNVSTNPTGYGSANSLELPSTTTKAYVLWRYWTDTDFGGVITLSSDDITAILATGVELTPVKIALSTDSEDVFSDGIHQIQYVPAQQLGFNGTFTASSKIVTLSGGSGIAALLANNALVWVGVVESGTTRFYEIDTTGTNNDTQLTMKTAYSGTGVTNSVLAGASADLKVLVDKAGEACIVSSTGKLADIPGTCLDVEATLNKLIRWQFAAGIQYDCKDYDGAHNLIVSINKYCTSGKCVCNS